MSEPNGGTDLAYEPPMESGNGEAVEANVKMPEICPDVAISTTEKLENQKTSDKKEKPKIVSLPQLFRFADPIDYILMICGTICACGHGVGMPALFIIVGSATDEFVKFSVKFANSSEPLSDDDKDYFVNGLIRPKCIYIVVVGICVLFVAYGQVMFRLSTSHRQTRRIRVQFLRSVLRQEVGWFDTHDVGEIGIKLTDDVNKIQAGIGDKIGSFFQFTSTFVVGIIIALVKGWKLALVILATTPILAGCGALMMRLITASTRKESEAYAKAGSIAGECLSAIRTVVVFGGEEKECQRYNSNLQVAKAFGIRKNMVNGGGMGTSQLVIFCTYALAFWFGGRLTVPIEDSSYPSGYAPGEYSIGQFLTVFMCAVMGATALGSASPNIEFIAAARGSAYAIWNIIDRESEIDSMSEVGKKPSSLTGNIEIVGAKFHYPSRPDVRVLNGLSVTIQRGQTVALVGSSGCGKSTVIQLIQRFYDPLEGAVMIDGTDIRQLNIQWLRQHIGVVSQEPVLFATTIGENIRYGREGVTQEEIEKAAKEANAHDFISQLPLNYDTLVGERGAQLSGGQKQRIAIARALVRDPKILLLDEATSALDTESEASVQAALDKARQGRTTVVVAHRLSTIKTADIIYGLKSGVAHECGTHDELMELKGIYHQLVMNQQAEKESDAEDDEDSEDEIIPKSSSRAASRASLMRKFRRQSSAASATSLGIDEEPLDEKTEENEASFGRIMKMNAPEWMFVVLGCLSALVHGGVQPCFGLLVGGFLGIYNLLNQPEKMMPEIIFHACMFIVIGAGIALSMFFQFWMFGISGEALTLRIRQLTFRALLHQEMSYFDDPRNSVGSMTTRLATDASAVQGATGVRLGMMLQAFACIGIGLVIGFIFSWKFTLFIIAIVPFLLMAGSIQVKLAKGFSGKNNKLLEDAGKLANECLNNIRTVAGLTKEPQFLEVYEKLNVPIYRQNLKSAQLFGVVFAFLQSIIYFAYAAIYYFGGWLVAYDGMPFASMYKIYIAIIFGALSLGRELAFAPDYGKAMMSAARIFTLLDRKPKSIDSSSKEGLQPTSCSGTVEFQDVHFEYPTRPTIRVLRGLNLKIEQGSTIALVGSSGCGKSTCVQLLERFYDVSKGHVMVDGNSVKALNMSWLRSQLGLVSQEPTLFGYSIRENIAYGDNSRVVTMEDIIEAAKKANIHTFIESLPQGYETNVGDRGTQLSGGQKQRIAIARALVRNPKILLLDEATSALDTESEKIVQEALDRAQEGRTCLTIAHRLSTIQNASCIVVFQHGHVTEQGTHSELMALKGLYYKLVMTQGHKR